MLSIYLQGLSLGLASVAPIGMQNLFVINSAISQNLGRVVATVLIITFWDFGSLSNVGVPFKSSTTDRRECFFLTSFFIVVLHETAIESVLGIY